MLRVEISLSEQSCRVIDDDAEENCVFEAAVSTAKNGPVEGLMSQ